MHQNIPAELRALKQWVVSGSSKIPYNPITGMLASPTDPATWATFEDAVKSGAPNLGFVLTRDDPYCVIDLDDKPDKPASAEAKIVHQKILERFETYQEKSVSGHGYHVVVKGAIPTGVNRDNVEMYSSGRYIIFTGNVTRNLSIADGYQEFLDILYGQMAPKDILHLEDSDEVEDDMEIVEKASNATNADKYLQLVSRNWEQYLPDYDNDPSKMDLALISMLTFYSPNDEQVKRLFRMTSLSKRVKDGKPRHHNDKAIEFTLRRARSTQYQEPVDMSTLLARMQTLSQSEVVVPAPSPLPTPKADTLSLPPGLIGEIAQWVYQTSQRPVPEISLITAIALIAGVAGRSYSINGAGLSQYLLLLAKTGTGKEAANSAISNILAAVRHKVPTALDFLGPTIFSAGPALHRILAARPSFVSVISEFGLLIQKITSKNRAQHDNTLLSILLQAYGKNGPNQLLSPQAYSDKEKDIAIITNPALTILGESTPESYYDGLEESAITSGFLPRFLIIEYKGDRVTRNPNPGGPPPDLMVQKIADLMSLALQSQANGQCLPVRPDSYAAKLLDAFDTECDDKIRGARDVVAQVWNRAHLKALKLAGLLAVGVNPWEPVVTQQMAEWAVTMVRNDCLNLVDKFKRGDVGEGESKQQAELVRLVEEYAKGSADDASKYHTTPKLHAARAISYKYLLKRTNNLSAFKHDRLGATAALNNAIRALCDSGQLVEIDKPTLSKLGYGGRALGIGSNWGV